jgi:hypothetical protein
MTYNLLDDFRRTVQIDDTLVNAHLKVVPGLGALTARRLAGGDAQDLGRHSNGSLHSELLVLGALDQVSAHLLQAFHISARQSDADAVDRRLLFNLFTFFLVRLFEIEIFFLDRLCVVSADGRHQEGNKVEDKLRGTSTLSL